MAKPKKNAKLYPEQMTINLSSKQRKLLGELAVDEDRSMNAVLRRLIDDEGERFRKRKNKE